MKKAVKVEIDGVGQAFKLGLSRFNWRDPYYAVLTVTWAEFFGLVLAFYILANVGFALLYLMAPDSIAGARPGSFFDAFFFSVETLATVGYGAMTPHSFYGHALSSLEIVFGVVLTAMITGLVFARFSRPQARLLFSDVAVIAPYEGQSAVMCRVVSERRQGIADARARMMVLREFRTSEGHVMRRFTDLELERSQIPIIALSWTLIHVIDEKSPLWGKSEADFQTHDARIFLSINGYDEAISAAIVSRKIYPVGKIRFGHAFQDIMTDAKDGKIVLDLNHFHDTREMPLGMGRTGAQVDDFESSDAA